MKPQSFIPNTPCSKAKQEGDDSQHSPELDTSLKTRFSHKERQRSRHTLASWGEPGHDVGTNTASRKLTLEVVCNGISEKAAILRSERESR